MRSLRCDICNAQIEMNSTLLARAASDLKTMTSCPKCVSEVSVSYVENKLTAKSHGRMLYFRAERPLEIVEGGVSE